MTLSILNVHLCSLILSNFSKQNKRIDSYALGDPIGLLQMRNNYHVKFW